MTQETRQCQNCKQSFTIEPQDFKFYEKIQVPPPTFCPDCRYQRRLAHRNERVLYNRTCDATGEAIVSIYPQDVPFPIYEQAYWMGDKWDSMQYGRDFDFSRLFFEQFEELQRVVPRINLRNNESVNSKYTNQCEHNKDCYLLVASCYSENTMYANWAMYCKDSLEAYNLFRSEWCYEGINCQLASNLFWCMQVESSFECWFSYDLRGCNNCFLSSNLRNKSYYWENEPLSKEEYQKRFAVAQTGSFTAIRKLRKKWLECMERSLHKFSSQRSVQNVSGDMIFESKNVSQSFNVTRSENVKYCADVLEIKDCMDNTEVAFRFERNYEAHGSPALANTIAANICWESFDLSYCNLCGYSNNLFGCIALKQKKYCILNKQYSKEDYNALKLKIIEHMKKTGEWGEFFPVTMSPFAYNETTALEYFPLTKEQVLQRGWRWSDTLPGTFGKGTVAMQDIPDNIKDVSETINKEILTCQDCGNNYLILLQELVFYQNMVLPIPRQCPNCRHYARLALRNPRKLWHRQCVCKIMDHRWHPKGRCPNEFETTYAPERPEIVYCEKCYLAEVA